MASIENTFFILQFIVCSLIMFCQLYNVISVGKWYELKMSILMFVGSIFSFGIGTLIFLLDPETLVYSTLYFLQGGLITISLFLFIGELFLHTSNNITGAIKPRMGRLDKDD